MERFTFDVPGDWRHRWPCSVLAGHRVTVELADNGDLVDLDADTDTTDLEAAELTSAIETYSPRLEREAFKLGADAARAAASWTCDGNSDIEERRRVLEMMRAGDPAADDYLPRRPDLAGEWDDEMTPTKLAEELGADEVIGDDLDALCQAFENGVSETFEQACEAELIKFCEDRYIAYSVRQWEGHPLLVSVLVPSVGDAPLVHEIGWLLDSAPDVIHLPAESE